MPQGWWDAVTYFGVVVTLSAALVCVFVFFYRVSGIENGIKPLFADKNEIRQNMAWLGVALGFFVLTPMVPGLTYYGSRVVSSLLSPIVNAPHSTSGFTFDTTVNVEGLATAAAACGAAAAYILDLIRRRISERNGKRRNSQAKVIVEVLQKNWTVGASESE